MFNLRSGSILQTQCFPRQVWMNWSDNLEESNFVKNVGSTVVSHFVPSTLVLRRGICYSALQCHQSSEVWPTKQQQGGKLVQPGWSWLAPAGPRWPSCWPGWPPATCLGQGKPPHQPVLTQCSSRHCKLVRKALQCTAASKSIRDLGSDSYRSG